MLTVLFSILFNIFLFRFLIKINYFKFFDTKIWKIRFLVVGLIIGLIISTTFQINCPKKKYISDYEDVVSIQTKERFQGNIFTGFVSKTYYEYYVKDVTGSLHPREINFEDAVIVYVKQTSYVMTPIREKNKEIWMNYIGFPIDKYILSYLCMPQKKIIDSTSYRSNI